MVYKRDFIRAVPSISMTCCVPNIFSCSNYGERIPRVWCTVTYTLRDTNTHRHKHIYIENNTAVLFYYDVMKNVIIYYKHNTLTDIWYTQLSRSEKPVAPPAIIQNQLYSKSINTLGQKLYSFI